LEPSPALLFCPGQQTLDKIETICFQQEKFGNITKTFLFLFQNDIGTFVLLFFDITSIGKWEEVTKWQWVGSPRPTFSDSISPPHSPCPMTASDSISGGALTRRDEKFSLKKKGSQIMLAGPIHKWQQSSSPQGHGGSLHPIK
jgi:hypothetical protein